MAFQQLLSLILFLFAWNVLCVAANHPLPIDCLPFNRTCFPPDFLFGAAASAYQTEGAWNESGKGPSNWDNFTHKSPSIIVDQSNGDVAVDFYNRYKEDIKLAKDEGLESFRFSIAWSRILPHGKLSKGINWAGIDFYDRVIDELIAQGIIPCVTLFHWDVPQALEDEYLGFLSPKIVKDFVDYVEICFRYFGHRIKHWITINEPYSVAINAYDYGIFAPGRCSDARCSTGNSRTEPYVVAHNLLLAHAAAAKLYKQKYQAVHKGIIGLSLYSQWFEPNSNKLEDIKAHRRAIDFMLGWYLQPVVYGDYPEDMKRILGDRLPKFTTGEKQLLKGSYDFIGLNYYTAYFASPLSTPPHPEYTRAHNDSLVSQTTYRDGKPIGIPTSFEYNFVVPWGLRKLLLYVKRHYKNPDIYITETGMPEVDIAEIDKGTNDTLRVYLYKSFIEQTYIARKRGVKVHGFYAWSLTDNFEWFQGYTQRFGINFIDYSDNFKRYPKQSALWIKKFLLR